jgi:hypothetical protein
MKNPPPEYTSMSERISAASSKATLRRLEISASRVYTAGFLTPRQLARLDDMLLSRLIALDDAIDPPRSV